MTIPEEFRQLCHWFYQGSRDDFATYDEWFADALKNFDREGKQVIKRFIDQLLSGGYSDDQLRKIWRSAGPDYDFSDGAHRLILGRIRDIADGAPVTPAQIVLSSS